jgi:hypothetical protein
MSAKQDRAPSLGHAELRLILFLEDLERSVETAERLANAGLEDEAIRIIDLQREALAHLPEQIARDVTPAPRRRIRRVAAAAVAAAFTVAASIAGTLGVVGSDAMTANEVAKRLAFAQRITNPTQRLSSLEDAVSGLASLDSDDPARASLSDQASDAARQLADDERDEGRRRGIAERAEELARFARAQSPAAPAHGVSPIDELVRDFPEDIDER